jgi:hypothetical protein
MRDEWTFNFLSRGLFVRFADGRVSPDQPISVQGDILPSVFFAIRFQPSHMLRLFDSSSALAQIVRVLFHLFILSCSHQRRFTG